MNVHSILGSATSQPSWAGFLRANRFSGGLVRVVGGGVMGRGTAVGIALAIGCLAQSAAWAADAPDLKSRAHTVAVISAMGDRIYFQPANVSMFDADCVASRVLSGADLDGAAVQAATDTLRADLPGVHIVTANIPRDQLVS